MNPNQNPSSVTRRVTCNLALALVAAFCLIGCASNKMALEANKSGLANVKKPVGIFTLRTENTYKPSYEPEVKRLKVVSSKTKDQKMFVAGKPYKQQKEQYLEYLISVDLDPGGYSLGRVEGGAGSFLISGHFEFPANAHFELTDGITYLGHVKMVNRERREGEERSGGIFPLIDQSTCGFSGGTFDITVTDRSETDIPDFVQAYPSLRDVTIKKAIMTK